MFSIDGLVSGLDTTSIINGLISIQESQIERLNIRKDEILTEQTAFQGIEARLLSLRSAMSQLNRSIGSVFESRQAVSSDDTVLTATASNNAIEGSYSIQVNNLATAHQIASQGFSSESASITQGSFSLKLGNRPETTITIDSSNDTLTGLVNAINEQSDDISAAIVFDQSTGSDRILLTANETGQSNQITITNNLAADNGNAVRPDFSGPAVQDATNASVQLGSGAGAITAEYESNEIDGLIQGVTLNLVSADPGTAISVNVSRDTEGAANAINNFVDEYNSLMSYIEDQTRYLPDSEIAGPLLGNRSVSQIRNRISGFAINTVAGLDQNLNRLSQIGITIGNTGQLTINNTKLQSALSGDDDISLRDMQRLFGLTAESTNSGIEFLLGSSRTRASTDNYEVDILQAAEQASVTGVDLKPTIDIDQSNDELQISVDGETSEVLKLTQGSYTQEEFVSLVQATINSSSDLGNRDVSVSLDNGKVTITSESYGSNSTINSISGTAAGTLGFTGSESAVGKDVAGSFIVNGVVETATGTGRLLMGDPDNENTADLQVRVTLDPSQVSTDVEGELSVSRGVTSQLDFYLGEILDPTTGSISAVNEEFDLKIESFEQSMERVRAISESKREYLIEQFTALERVLSELQTTSGFLASQLASIPTIGS